MPENDAFLKEQIITYLGNKRALLPFIANALKAVKKDLNKNKLHCLDLFSGSGIVARFLKQHSALLWTNDLELYSKITNQCYLSNKKAVDGKSLLKNYKQLCKQLKSLTPGFIAELYAPKDDNNIQAGERVFYTRRNAEFLDTARQAIAHLDPMFQVYFLAPLLAEASVHNNTSGIFKGFYKNKQGLGQFGGQGQNALGRILKNIELKLPIFSNYNCDFMVSQEDANSFVETKASQEFDLAYLDPPYNQHPYGSNYFMLNLIAHYEKPEKISEVSGIAEGWNKSPYNRKKEAQKTLFDLIAKCNAKYILISYNSEGLITKDIFVAYLKSIGKLEVLENSYSTFKASRNLKNRQLLVTEFLFLLKK